MANILIFGDSITYGCWDTKGGWALRLKNHIDQKIISDGVINDHFVYPLGIPGDTTHTLLQRFKQETDSRIVPHEASVFIFSIGINDSIFNNKMNSQIIPFWKYKNNLQVLIQSAKRYSKNIVFVGLNPVDEATVDPMSWLPDCSYKNAFVEEYNNGLDLVCRQESVKFINIFAEWKTMDYKKLLFDGIHPNGEGHQQLFAKISENITTFL